MKPVQLLLIVIILSAVAPCLSAQTAADTVSTSASAASARPQQRVTAYTLSPGRYQKARNLAQIHFRFRLIGFAYGLFVLWLILRLKVATRYRSWSERVSRRRFLQALVFSPLLLLTIAVFALPADMYENWVSRIYGLSIQSWGSWAWDWTKGQLVSILIGTIFIWLLYLVIHKSPRRWWFYFWLVSLPLGLFVVFLTPLVIDPLFHKFEPLAVKDPALTHALETMVQHAGENIPPERMFWMGAGEKTTELNAYVTGFGASKRIVVWDNTIARMTTPQIVYVAGHEMGHYVLRHVPKGLALGALFSLAFFYLGYRCIGLVLKRWGPGWEIRGVDDWASLPAMLLLLSVFGFVANPVFSAISRHFEHQADQYGLEVTHGLTPDSAQVAAQSFQILGDVDLADPDPSPVAVFLFYSHPTIPDRIQFALHYDPWEQSKEPEFVK
ncbi:MAG: M48 family metallopeptidase [Terriglobales bacterium]